MGAGQAVKLVNQLLVAVAEPAVFGAKLGADPRVTFELVGASFGGSTMMTRNLPRFISCDFAAAMPVSLLLKDLGLVHDEARNSGVPIVLTAVAEQCFLAASARGLEQQDMASLVRLGEEPAGIELGR